MHALSTFVDPHFVLVNLPPPKSKACSSLVLLSVFDSHLGLKSSLR